MCKKRLNEAVESRTYTIEFKRFIFDYCYICQRRAGSYYADCGPIKIHGYHGSGKIINGGDYRSYRSWKHTRKKQYKT